MHYSEFELQTEQGIQLFGRKWMPENAAPKAVICLMHGLGEHSGRYADIAQHLVSTQYGILAIDQIGHGKSGGKRGHVRHYDDVMESITLLLTKARQEYPDQPIFLFGHSWGGNQALNYALRKKPALQGIIALSPWLKLAFDPPVIKVLLGRWMNRIFPAFIEASGLNPDFISRDPAIVKAYINDPLVHDRISASLFVHTMHAADWALEHAAGFSLPLLLIHGTEDRLISPQGTQAFAGKIQRGLTFRLFEGSYHETHNDLDKKLVWQVVSYWLDTQVAANEKGGLSTNTISK